MTGHVKTTTRPHWHLRESALEDIFFDFLQGDRSGRLFNFMYQDALTDAAAAQSSGISTWDKILAKDSRYYIFPNEAELIARAADDIAAATHYRSTLVELGVGSRKSVEQKTLPLIHALKPQRFVANDLAREAVMTARRTVIEALPFLNVDVCQADFLVSESDVFGHAPANVIMTGSSVSNITFYDGNVPVNEVAGFMRMIGGMLGEEGSLIITQDTNHDRQSVLDAYNVPEMKQCKKNTLFLVKALLDVPSFDAEALQHEPVWEENCGLLVNSFVNTKDQTVRLGARSVHLPAGKRLYLSNCYKYRKDAFLHMCSLAGLEAVNTWMDAEDRVALHVLRKRR